MKTFWQFLNENPYGYYGDTPEITGEYWITEGGDVQYADGDIGTYNHEGYVVDTIQRQIIDAFGLDQDFDQGEFVDWDGFVKELIREKRAEYGWEEDDSEPDYSDSDSEIHSDDEILAKAIAEEGITQEEFDLAQGHGDARLHAVKKWGWKVVHGHYISTWTLQDQDKKAIARGIGEILEQESGSDSEGWDELEFRITVVSTGKSFDMTLAELEGHQQNINPTGAEIDTYNKSFSNVGKNLFLKKPVPPGTGSQKTAGDMSYADYRRNYLNNWGEANFYTLAKYIDEIQNVVNDRGH